MKVTSSSSVSFLVLLVQACSTVLASPYLYKGLAVTSIDVIDTGKVSEEGNPIVTFDGSIQGSASDQDAVFLKHIKDNGKTLEAEKLTVKQAKDIINGASADKKGKPLFCIHGFNVQPRSHLKTIKDVSVTQFNEGKFMPVPVMWPSKGGANNYLGDRVTSPGAGNGLKSLKKALDSFPQKSLLAHSMGNRVLRYAADAKFKFDNIFMVAADVRHTIFREEYINSGDKNDPNRPEVHGLKIIDMLSKDLSGKPKGKVYVLVNGADYALNVSNWDPTKWISRLGAVGAHYKRNWMGLWREDKSVTHPDVVNYVINVMCNPKLSWNQKTAHSYQFFPQIVDIYQSKHF